MHLSEEEPLHASLEKAHAQQQRLSTAKNKCSLKTGTQRKKSCSVEKKEGVRVEGNQGYSF